MYGYESWTIKKAECRSIGALDGRLYYLFIFNWRVRGYSSQGYGFSSGHVLMCDLDYKES